MADEHDAQPVAEPGEQPPRAGRGSLLEAAPSRRYAAAGAPGGDPSGGDRPGGHSPHALPAVSLRGPLAGAILVAAIGALGLTGMMAILTATTGTILLTGIAGAAIGLIVAATAVPAAPGAIPALTRAATVRLAVLIAVGMIAASVIGTWLVARIQGGVLDPLTFAWTVFGFGFPALAVAAAATAAWGAANGPVRRG